MIIFPSTTTLKSFFFFLSLLISSKPISVDLRHRRGEGKRHRRATTTARTKKMSFTRPSRSHSLNQPPPMAEKLTDDPVTSRTAQSTVTCVYTAFIAGKWRRVTVTWCKDLMHHFFTVTIHAPADTFGGDFFHRQSSTCKVDLKPWHFWSKKGYKSFVLGKYIASLSLSLVPSQN